MKSCARTTDHSAQGHSLQRQRRNPSNITNVSSKSLTTPFAGILRIAATAPDIAAVGLRLAINQRHDILVTTTPPADENATPSASGLFFPHFVDSGGWTTQFILFSATAGQTASGLIRFTGQDGQPLTLSVAPTAAPTIP